MRLARVQRSTLETDISLTLEIDGTGIFDIDTGCGFLNHMLELFTKHGRFDITLTCQGDVEVDYHHTVEDVGIVLARAFSQALGERIGIWRYGSFVLPMDETLVLAAIDISNRPFLQYQLNIPNQKIGDFDVELIKEFFAAFSRELGCSIHLHQISGENSHHISEAAFKGFARALSQAVSIDEKAPDEIPSSKGTIL